MKMPRVDYEAIAELYDTTPYREKPVDPELLAFAGRRASSDRFAVLDIACGTGNQLIADRAALDTLALVGLDRSLGMRAYSDDVGRAFRLMSATCSDRSRPAVPIDVGRGGGSPAGRN
jgi:SAM-dependent methyltransferase